MSRFTRAEWLVAGLIAVVLVLLALPLVQKVSYGGSWVGSIDLEVVFAATDAVTGAPIPGAEVEVQSDGGFYEERQPRDFRMIAGPDGRAAHLCRNTMCFGTREPLLTDSFDLHLPHWRFRASAPGYEPTALEELEVPEFHRAVRREGPHRAVLVVPIPLRKR
jgi:hypothetical protein